MRAAALSLALALAACAGPPSTDGGLADDVRGLWVQSQPAVVLDTIPGRAGEPDTVRPRTRLWSSFRATDSTLTREGIDRIVFEDTILTAGGSRRRIRGQGRVLTVPVDTLVFQIQLAVRGDSLTVTHDDGTVQRYGRAQSAAPAALVGTWETTVADPDLSGDLRVFPDGTLGIELSGAAVPDEGIGLPDDARVLGGHIVWGRRVFPTLPGVADAYWGYDTLVPYTLDGDRLVVRPAYDPPVELQRVSP